MVELKLLHGIHHLYRDGRKINTRTFNQIDIINWLYDDDRIVCRVNYPSSRAAGPVPWLVYERDGKLFRMQFASKPVWLDYMEGDREKSTKFKALHGFTIDAHQRFYWLWDKLMKKPIIQAVI